MIESMMLISAVFTVMAALLSIPFLLVRMTEYENNKYSRWSRFLKCLKDYPWENRLTFPSLFSGGFIYYFLYKFSVTGNFSFLVFACCIMAATLGFTLDLFHTRYRWLHIKVLKLSIAIAVTLIPVSLGYSFLVFILVGLACSLKISILCVIERTILRTSRISDEILDTKDRL